MTRAERRVLALLADGEWHDETEIRSTRAMLDRLHWAGSIEGAMLGVGAWPEHRLWRLRPATPPEAPARPAPEAAGSRAGATRDPPASRG
jgi:hypothetical protein